MEYNNNRLNTKAGMTITILSAGCGIPVTSNIYNVKPNAPQETDCTTQVLQLGSQSPKPKDGQR